MQQGKFTSRWWGVEKGRFPVTHTLPPKEKKDLIGALIEGNIEFGDGLGDGEKWQIVRMPLVLKAEAFKRLLGG